MPQITLTIEQEHIVKGAAEAVLIRNAEGQLIGLIPPRWTEADIAEAKRRQFSDAPRHTTEELVKHLRSLGAE